MNHKEIFSSNLRIKKEELKLTQGQLANKLRWNRSKIASYLKGRAAPRLEDIPNICEVFKIKDFNKFITEEIKNTA